MRNGNRMKHLLSPWMLRALLLIPALISLTACSHAPSGAPVPAARLLYLDGIGKDISAFVPDARYPDDPFVLVTVQEAMMGARERNGGIGACLVREATGEVLERGHNSQYEPWFRSSLHAEMVLLDRYEERMRLTRSRDPRDASYLDPRAATGLVLYTSVEPCPMCLTRIINAGIKKVYYAAPDINGGMASRFENLPPFWKGMAEGMVLEPARCSPSLTDIAAKLFRPMHVPGAKRL
jgi:tRNA(adenine34) deaminase